MFVGLIICTYLVIFLDYMQFVLALQFMFLVYSTIYMSVLIDTLYNMSVLIDTLYIMDHTILYRSSTTTTQVTSISLVSELE